ncbi:MAG: ATP-binding protein [Bacteroidales bacterium]|nr:ATP-binding protein [Bacteroidales bacterium]MCM1416060.1 ATP-binding protein [bacterium]MCM1422803.1 ATP-binding protein [bacterium]
MQYIRRTMEKRLEKYSRTYKAVLVTGARQVGKSTLLKKVFPERRYVSLDDPFLEEQAKQDGDMFLRLNPAPVSIDEVQRAKELFRYIKIRCDESEEKGLFCLSGSQPFHLMEGVSESLSGRIGIIELSGLSMRELSGDPFDRHFLPTMEYMTARKETVQPPENLWTLIHRGSYPEMADSEKEWSAFYADYVKTYLERDVRALAAVQDLNVFRRFMTAAAARTGQILNYSNIASEIGKDADTVKRWISILEASGVIYLLEPYASSALKRAVKSPKLYFRDTGLACYLTRWLTPETLAYGAMNGALFETFAISEILKSFSNEGLDYRYMVSYYRGKDKGRAAKNGKSAERESEIDFIIEENGVLYPVEIKMNSKATADMTAAFQVLDKVPEKKRGTGAVLCTCPQPGMLRENVFQIPIWYV